MKNNSNITTKQRPFYVSPKAPEQEAPKAYSELLNAKGTNALATLPTTSRRAALVFTPYMGKNSLFTPDEVKITIDNPAASSQLGNSILFFYYMLTKFTKQTPHNTKGLDLSQKRTREIPIDVEEFLRIRGKEISPDNKKNAARDIRKYYDTLKNISLDFEEYDPKTNQKKRYLLELFSGRGEALQKKSKSYFFILNEDVAQYLTEKNYITQFPNAGFAIDLQTHPNALSLLIELTYFYSMNIGKPNQGTVSLKALLEKLSDIPRPEEIKEERHITRRIIDPLEKDLDHLVDKGALESWEWANKKKEPLELSQLENYSYKALSDCYLIYKMKDYPVEGKKALEAPKEEPRTPKKV